MRYWRSVGRMLGKFIVVPFIFLLIIVGVLAETFFNAIGLRGWGGPVFLGLIILTIIGWVWYRFIRKPTP